MKILCTTTPLPPRILALALAYFISGKLGLLLAVPPGYATAVWPPSGVALAGLLLLGGRCWPGVWLGSFCVNVGMSFDASGTAAIWRSLAIAASIGLGASLQAAAGAWLVRRFVGWPAALIRNGEILAFLCLGGPAGCLVGATWGVGTLWIAGVVPGSAWLMNWGTWWVGDTIGIWIFATIGLIAFAQPREVWRQRWQSVALPLAVSFATAVGVFWLVEKNENTRLHATFAQQAREQVNRFGYATHVHSVVLHDLVNLFAASEQVTRGEFDTYARGAMKSDPRITALAWVPRLPDEAAAPRGEEHFFILAADGTPRSRAFLADSETVRLHAMQRARDLGRDTATAPILMAGGKERGFVIFVPFFGRGADDTLRATSDGDAALIPQRRERLQGYVAGVFDVESVVREAFGDTAFHELHLRIHDVTDRAGGEPVFTADAAQESGDTFRRGWSATVNVGERTWRLHFTPTLEYLARHQSLGAWSVLASAFFFTSLLGSVLLVSTGRTALVEATVAERTRELARANEELHGEVAARQAAETQITASLREKETLLKEIHHRVKNNLQIISSMLNLRARGGVTPEMAAMLRECQDRIRSMSILHETLYRSDSLTSVDLGKYLQGVVSTLRRFHSTERIELHCAMEPIIGDADTAIPLGLIVNELATNAFKHAFPDGRPGRVTVSLQHDREGGLELEVRDDGVGPPASLDLARPASFGLRLVQIFVKQLHGRFTSSGDERGAAFQVRVSRAPGNPTPCIPLPKALQPISS